jgi:hypothetical protein
MYLNLGTYVLLQYSFETAVQLCIMPVPYRREVYLLVHAVPARGQVRLITF